jgi:hypothetical protein
LQKPSLGDNDHISSIELTMLCTKLNLLGQL